MAPRRCAPPPRSDLLLENPCHETVTRLCCFARSGPGLRSVMTPVTQLQDLPDALLSLIAAGVDCSERWGPDR